MLHMQQQQASKPKKKPTEDYSLITRQASKPGTSGGI